MIGLLAALLLAAAPPPAAPAETPKPAATAADAAKPAPLTPTQAVDANGVPAWAKRKRLAPVQNCTGRPNIGVETWRAEQDPNSKVGAPRPVPVKTTCK
jgi:hypothetical protein